MVARSQVMQNITHNLAGVLLVVIGCLILAGILQLPELRFEHALMAILVAAALWLVPNNAVHIFAVSMSILGVYIILQLTGIITITLLTYALGAFLVGFGIISVVSNVRNGGTRTAANHAVATTHPESNHETE